MKSNYKPIADRMEFVRAIRKARGLTFAITSTNRKEDGTTSVATVDLPARQAISRAMLGFFDDFTWHANSHKTEVWVRDYLAPAEVRFARRIDTLQRRNISDQKIVRGASDVSSILARIAGRNAEIFGLRAKLAALPALTPPPANDPCAA
jgi:hypothetical protein